MTNQQIIAKLSTQLIDRIEGMVACGMTHTDAILKMKTASCAGSSVWAIVNVYFDGKL